MLGLSVTLQPLDGSPALTQPIQFLPVAGLGQPALTAYKSPAHYVGAWLNSGVSGISGTGVVGVLQITLRQALSEAEVRFAEAARQTASRTRRAAGQQRQVDQFVDDLTGAGQLRAKRPRRCVLAWERPTEGR